MRHSAVRNCMDCESMKRSLRVCELGAAAGAATAALVLEEVSLPALEALAFEDGLALALLVCLCLAALLVRAPAGASAKLVSRTASASFVFIIVICLPNQKWTASSGARLAPFPALAEP